MKKLLSILLFVPVSLFGQEWEINIGTENAEIGYAVKQTSDGGYAVLGIESDDDSASNTKLIKLDQNGIVEWTKHYTGDYSISGYSLELTSDDGYIIVGGLYKENGLADIYIIRTNFLGDTIWTKSYGDYEKHQIGFSVAKTIDDGFIISGQKNVANGDTRLILLKIDDLGNTVWEKNFAYRDEFTYSYGRSITKTSDGGFIVTGETYDYGEDIWVIKTDFAGDSIWTQHISGQDDDYPTSIIQTSDQGYVLSCYSNSLGSVSNDIWLIKLDSFGDTLWSKTFGGEWPETSGNVIETLDGGFVICGTTRSYGNGGQDMWLIKTDVLGNVIWTKTFGGNSIDEANYVQQTNDGGYILVGESSSNSNGLNDIKVIKTNSLGEINFTTIIDSETLKDKTIIYSIDFLGRRVNYNYSLPLINIYEDGSSNKILNVDN